MTERVSSPKLAHVDEGFLIWDKVFTSEEVLISKLALKVQKWLIKA